MPFTNFFWVAMVLWPVTVQVAALANMLIWMEFSGTEIILDWFVGFGIGSCFWLFTNDDPNDRAWWRSLLMVFSQGIFGLLGMTSIFPSVGWLFWWSAGSTVGATILASLLDHAAIAIGAGHMTAGGVLLSVLIFLLKAPFCLFTTAVGLLIFIAGLCHLGASNTGAGFLGGVTYEEWDQTASPVGVQATTVGATVHCWRLHFCENMCHELNHSRQCIYMHDLMIPTWAIGFVVSGGDAGQSNPVENVAYKIEGSTDSATKDNSHCNACGDDLSKSASPLSAPPKQPAKPAPKPEPKPKPKP